MFAFLFLLERVALRGNYKKGKVKKKCSRRTLMEKKGITEIAHWQSTWNMKKKKIQS